MARVLDGSKLVLHFKERVTNSGISGWILEIEVPRLFFGHKTVVLNYGFIRSYTKAWDNILIFKNKESCIQTMRRIWEGKLIVNSNGSIVKEIL